MSRVWGRGALARALVAPPVAALLSLACSQSEPPMPPPAPPSSSAVEPVVDTARVACQAHKQALLALNAAGGSPVNGPVRSETLGRARGEPLVWLREPKSSSTAELPSTLQKALGRAAEADRDDPKIWNRRRIAGLLRTFPREKNGLRQLLLREGYVYSKSPLVALALTFELKLEALFDEERLTLQRGASRYELLSKGSGRSRHYEYQNGPLAGERAELLFGDWVGLSQPEAPGDPVALDFSPLAHEYGAERIQLTRLTTQGSLAKLRLGAEWFNAVLKHDAAGRVSMDCLDEDVERRALAAKLRQSGAWKRTALAHLRGSVDAMLRDGLRFDRPRGEEGPDRDGELRPVWYSAYRFGQSYFRVDETSYAVFAPDGTPTPPQVCVDFVLESFERASGTWFTPKSGTRERKPGGLDFNTYGIKNRRGVLALEDFGFEHPELFEGVRFKDEERIPFAKRQEFFGYLESHADEFAPGDIVAIRGVKGDGRVHQHAILLERTDPLTGFAYGLADQMSKPRRRTWEGIMAEAPRRSLYFRLRLKPEVLKKLAGEAVVAAAHAASP
ncbi:MAG: hypothetical protein H6718_30380 [Polyangiaceae bacterium]|nr:hypothetical protein [Polyangiaceae bacterium]